MNRDVGAGTSFSNSNDPEVVRKIQFRAMGEKIRGGDPMIAT
jgi:hypothetical protein